LKSFEKLSEALRTFERLREASRGFESLVFGRNASGSGPPFRAQKALKGNVLVIRI